MFLTNNQVGFPQAIQNVVPVTEESRHVAGHHVVEVAQAIEVDIEDIDAGAEPGGDLGGIGADHAAAEDDDAGRSNAGHAGEQDAAALERPLQKLRPFLNAHPPRDLAHRRQERKLAACVFDRLISDGGRAGLHNRPSQILARGKMEIGEENLVFLHEGPFVWQRLLHLHDHVGFLPNRRAIRGDFGAAVGVLLVADAAALPRPGFDQHLVAGARQLLDADRRHGDAVFVRFHFRGHADDHENPRRCILRGLGRGFKRRSVCRIPSCPP